MPTPSELQDLRQRLKSLSGVCLQNAALETRQQLVSAAFGLSSDLSFLSQLFDVCIAACEDLKDDPQEAAQICTMGAAAALLYLPGRGLKILQQFLDCVFMPMLTSSRLPSQAYPQMASSLCSLLACEGGWAQLSSLLQMCREGLQQAGSVGLAALDAGSKKPGDKLCMPLHTCCCLAPSILKACCQPLQQSTPTALEHTHAGSETQTGAPKAEAAGIQLDPCAQGLLSSALEILLPQALDSIGCPNAPLRKANFHHVLPALISASRALGVQTLHTTMAATWDACLSLLPLRGIPRQAALAVMVQLMPLLQEQGEACMARVWHDALFWDRLRACLADDDALDRKRGAFLLQRLMPPTSACLPAWKTWLVLHDALDGFAPHLIFAAMAEMDKLHPVCLDSHHKQPAQSSGSSHSNGKATPVRQKAKAGTKESKADAEGRQNRAVDMDKKESADSAENGDAGPQHAPDAMGQLSSFGAGLPDAWPHRTAMAWLCVLWRRAIQHRNLQVQRAGLRQFLQRLWQSGARSPVPDEQGSSKSNEDSGASLRQTFRHSDVPFGFVVEVLIPAVCKDIHYKGRGTEAWGTQAAARTWLTEWLRHQPEHAQRDFLRHFLATLNTAGAEGFVQGLRILTGCMASAPDLHKRLSSSDAAASSQDSLATLRILVLRLQSFHNLQSHSQKKDADLRLEVHHCLLHIAHCAAPVGHVRVADAARFISGISPQDTVPGGLLNTAACAYLLALSTHLSSPQPTNQPSQQPPLKTTDHRQPPPQAQLQPTIIWDAAAVQAAQSALADLHASMAQYEVAPGMTLFGAGHVEALERHARLLSVAALICGSCPEAAHVSSLLTSAAHDLWPLYRRAYVHPIQMMKRVVLLKEILGAAVAQWSCWHGMQPLLYTLVEVCTSSTEALCCLGKPALGAFLPAPASRVMSASPGFPGGKSGGAGAAVSDQQAAQEWEQQQLRSRTVVEVMGSALVLLARMRPSLPDPRSAKLHMFLDALASTLLPLVASIQAIRPSTNPGAHPDQRTSDLGAHPGLKISASPPTELSATQSSQSHTEDSPSCAHPELKTSAPSPTAMSATQPPESQSTHSIPSTTSMAPPAGSAQRRTSAEEIHCQVVLLGAVQSACCALCEAAEDASVGAAVAAGLQAHEVLRALLLQLRGCAAENQRIAIRIWGCLDALMSLASKAAPHGCQSFRPAISFGDEPLPGKPPAGRPTFKLRQDVLPQLLLAALEELERGNNGDVLAVLRCFRRAWVQFLEDLEGAKMQEGVTAALVSYPGVEQPSLLDVVWRAVRAVCAAMKASKKKHPALSAAFISALLLPQLIPSPTKHTETSASGRGEPRSCAPQLADTDAQSPRAACRAFVDLGELGRLHDATGPVPWAINCILEWGFSSSSVMLLLSCHLASLIIRRPQLLKVYAPQLQQILTQSADDMDNGSLMRQTLSTPCTEIERELSTVLPSSDQAWLFDSLKSPGLAARAAVLCALHHLAEHAGLVWHPSHGPSPQGHPKSSHTSSVAALHARNPGSPAEPAFPRKRPIIIFEEGGVWEDVRQPPEPGSATKSNHGTISVAADVGSSTCNAHAETFSESGSSNRGLEREGGRAKGLLLSQESRSSQEGGSTLSNSSNTLRQGLSMLGRLSGKNKAGLEHEDIGHGHLSRSRGSAAGGQEYGQHGMKAAIDLSGRHFLQQSVSEGGWVLWRAMLHVASTRTEICTDKVKRDSDTHRLKVRVWQALAVLTSFVQPPHVEASLRSVIALMSSNDAPSVKQYQEATAAALLVKEPGLLEAVVLPTLESYQKPHPGIGSLVLVAVQVCLHVPERDHLLPKLLYATVPWLSSHVHSVRSYAQLVVYALLRQFSPECPIWSHTGGDCTYIQCLFRFLEDNMEFQRLCRNVGLPSMDWNPEGLASPRRLLCGDTALIQQTAETLSFEGAPATLLDRLSGFLQAEHIRLRKEMDKRAADTEELDRDARQCGATPLGRISSEDTHGLDFQRKVTTHVQTAAVAGSGQGFWGSGFRPEGSSTGGLYQGLFECGLGDLLMLSESSPSAKGDEDEAVEEGQGGEDKGAPGFGAASRQQRVGMRAGARPSGSGSCGTRQELIVVASLLDKTENLAGLSRTCEVFRAGLLVVPDLRVVTDPMFEAISVTAQKWVPLAEVREEALLEWLHNKKTEGYTCVGLEQTVESCKLPSYSFPNRCVLVLGKEKEGLPPEVIQMLDDSVEIPQLGLIRSLNVHVSGAIAMYEYTRQRACLDHC